MLVAVTGHLREGSGRTGALGLQTDLYELRMVETYVRLGMFEPATFSLYVRPSSERGWYVALGLERVCELLDVFRFGPEEIDYLRGVGFHDDALDWLASFEPTGEVWGVPEGTVVIADEPLVEVTAPLPVAQLLETAVMNLVQFPTLIATKAARIALAARGRPVADFGLRRAHGLETGVEAAMAAWVGGGLTTSNVEAGRRYGLTVVGTMAHSFVQAFDDELEAFRAFAQDHPDGSTLLVDTYDTLDGVRNAIRVADELRERGHRLQAIRLDSGDLAVLAHGSRRLLDQAGHDDVRIFASGGLDEFAIDDLLTGGAPIDAFGVGTTLVTSADRPAMDVAYKLVAYAGQPRAKYSEGKRSLPGAKQIFRTGGPDTDVLASRDEQLDGRRLLEPVWRDGARLRGFDLERARERAAHEVDAMPDAWRLPPYIDEPPRPRLSEGLRELADRVRRDELPVADG